MSNFKAKFIIQFIINFIVVGIILGILSRVAIALLFKGLDASGTSVCWLIVLTESIFNVAAMIISVFLTQKEIAKKPLDNFPLSATKFYTIVAAVLVIINILFAVFGYTATYNACVQNVDMLVMELEMKKSGTITDLTEIKNTIENSLHSAVRASVIVGNVIQTAALMGLIPLFTKKHQKLFM